MGRQVPHDNRASPYNSPTAYANIGPNRAANPHHGPLSNLDPTSEMHARSQVNVTFNPAIMVHCRTRINDTVPSKHRPRLDHRTRKDHRTRPELGTWMHVGPWVNYNLPL